MSRPPTTEQRAAIETTARRALVSASAGTGKTRVLVERYLRLITSEGGGVSPDEILAVTFTEAAATEMRTRVRDGLAQWASSQPDPSMWTRQVAGIDRAPISTIHAFCNRLLRQQYEALDIDPGYDILDENDGSLLMSEISERVIEESFELEGEEGEAFRRLASRTGGYKAASLLQDFVEKCARFLASVAEPEAWVEQALSGYRMAVAGAPQNRLPWFGRRLAGARDMIERARDLNSAARRRAAEDPGLAAWLPDLDRRIALCDGWAERTRPGVDLPALAREMLDGFDDMRRSKNTADPDAKAFAQKAYGKAREILNILAKERLLTDDAEVAALLADLAPDATAVMALVRRFMTRFREEKRRRGVLDFADLERETHTLLRLAESGAPNVVIPSFRHVLVDEFQDVNRLQDDILRRLAVRGSLFLVGDVKQCIYRFRQAEPRVLLEKLRDFEALTAGEGMSFPLTGNFRANSRVIGGVNALFGAMMSLRLGGVAYDARHALRAGDEEKQAPPAGVEPAVEIHIFDTMGPASSDDPDAADSWEAAEREAFGLGSRIKDLLQGSRPESTVRDPDSNALRRVEPRDIVVLLRAGKGYADLFESAFRRLGLAASASPAGSIFEWLEARQFVSLLRALDNPLWDVSLAAALRSPAFGFELDELVAARVARGREPLLESLRSCACGEGPPSRKAKEALERIDRWRTEARRRSLPDLVAFLLEETRLESVCAGRPDGDARRDALRVLFDRAREFERRHAAGLSRFVGFLDQLAGGEMEIESPAVPAAGRQAIRIQTIHQSKGLEYPVVAVARLGKGWNLSDRNDPVALARDAGIGLRWIDPMRIARRTTIARDAVHDEMREETLSEEMRLLYVAFTRARDRLLLSGTADLAALIADCSSVAGAGSERLPEHGMTGAKSALDWIAPAVALHPDGAPLRGDAPAPGPSPVGRGSRLFAVTLHDEAAILRWPTRGERGSEDRALLARAAALEDLGPADCGDDVPGLISRATWVYPAAVDTRRVAKASVSELKRRFDAAATADPTDQSGPALFDPPSDSFRRAPSFMSGAPRAAGALSRGRAMHAVLERMDLTGPLDAADVRRAVERLVRDEALDEASAALVEPERIAALFAGPLGARIRRDPSRVRREVPVNIAVGSEAWERWTAGDWIEPSRGGDEFVHVQGIVDCVVMEDDGLLLVEYKTDRVHGRDADRRAAFYRPQVVAYAAALGALSGRSPREAVLYFLEPGEARNVDLPW